MKALRGIIQRVSRLKGRVRAYLAEERAGKIGGSAESATHDLAHRSSTAGAINKPDGCTQHVNTKGR